MCGQRNKADQGNVKYAVFFYYGELSYNNLVVPVSSRI